MYTFYEWLGQLSEDRNRTVAPEVLQSYDMEMRRQLQQMATRIHDPHLRAQFLELLDCPLVDAKGRCRNFGDYVLGTLLKSGLDNRYDLEQVVQYIFDKMLTPRSDSGGTRTTLFSDFDPARPDAPEHFRARFFTWLKYTANNVKKGKVPRLANVERRPAGTVSIGQGRTKDEYTPGTVSPEQIASRPSTEGDFNELVNDIMGLLKKKEPAYGLPLSGVFAAMVSGKNAAQQRTMYGDTAARMARPVILRIVGEYAQQTQNHALAALVRRFQDFRANEPLSPTRTPQKVIKPVLDTKSKDYASIVSVIARYNGQPVGTAQLGSYRRRWLEYPPRTPGTTYRNRLEEVLAQMVADGVLRTVRGSQGALVYLPGPNYERFRQPAAV